MTLIEVRTVVDIPAFEGRGPLISGRVFVAIDDVCAYLTTVAATFDRAGANRDIATSLRAIRDGLTNRTETPV